MEEYNEETQRAKVGAGFKGGPMFKSPIEHPAMQIVDGVPAEVKAKQFFGPIQQGTPTDTWNSRRSK